MNTNTRSVLDRLTGKKALCGVGVAGLAAGVFLATGFARIPGIDPSSGPAPNVMVSTVAPVADSTVAPLLALNRATEAVVQRVLPSVVSISVTGKSGGANGPDQDQDQQEGLPPGMEQQIPPQFRQFFEGPFQYQQRPQQQYFQALGTGLIISPDGYIVTNNHMVAGETNVTVTTHDQRIFHNAKVVGTDPDTDLAVIKIDATGLPSAAWGNSSDLEPGDTVLAIGNPMQMDFSVTRGIVSALNRPRNMNDDPNARGVFIQTDAAINHGNSGGPLVNVYGEVVGINSEMLSSSGASDGIGFSIPSNLVKPTAASLIKNGKVVRGYLGIEVSDLSPDIANSLNESGTKGALIEQVNAGSPAAEADLKPYDVITKFDGETVTNGTDLQADAGATAPGVVAHVGVMRDGQPLTLAVTMGDLAKAGNPSEAAADTGGSNQATPKLGLNVAPLTPDLRDQLQLPSNVNGLVVQSVTPGGPAMIAGIAQGDVIEQVNQHAVSSVGELEQQLDRAPAGKDILLLVHRAQNGDFIVPVQPQS